MPRAARETVSAERATRSSPRPARPLAPTAGRPPGPPDRWTTAVLLLPVLIALAFNAVTLWPEVAQPVPNLNDSAVHYLDILRASAALANGENPFDHWLPQIELGFPMFLYYQHVPQLTVVFLHRLLLGRVDLLTLFNLVRYLIMVGFPLVVYWSMRRMGFSVVAAAVAAAASSLVSSNKGYGFEYGSYLWGGHGMYTQLWAMPLSFVTLACLDRLVDRGRGYVAAVLSCSLLVLTHLIYAYMMAISALVLPLVGLRRANLAARLGRLGVVGGLAGVVTLYMTLPFVLGKAYLSASVYLDRSKYDSFGAEAVLRWLADGDLLDAGRLPVLTALVALGVAAALFTRTRHARLALALFGVWLAIYFGRPTWGSLTAVFPLSEGLLFHRFIGGVHVAAILLIGLGGEWLWRQLTPVPARWRAAGLAVAVLVLLVPAFRERHRYYALNTQWIERTRRALATDVDAQAILATLRTLPPGRTYAGLRADWGRELRFGDVHFYDLLPFNQLDGVIPPYGGVSLNADLTWHFDDHRPEHYDTFNVKYVVAPRSWAPPDFLRPIKETARYVLYASPARGYAELAAISGTESPASQSALFFRSRSWFLGTDPAAHRFLRYDFPPDNRSSPAGAGERAGCPDGTVTEERVSPGGIDLRTACPGPSALVIKMTYHPNWRVAVDGTEVSTFMVSPSFIGVELPAGTHHVRAEYRSGLLKTALLVVGVATLLAMIALRGRFARLEGLRARAA